jgi:hypothetical protein
MSSISGRVMGSDGFGLNGVTVIASPVPGSDADQSPNSGAASVRYRTVSDSAGFYSFRRLPDGDYTIRNNEHGPYPATRISAHTGVDYADLVLREKRTFVVEGRVVAATGEPLERVTVLPIVLGVPSVRTDDRGRYRLPITLEPDVSRLTLRFQLPGFRETYATVPAPSVVETDVQAFDAVMQPLEYTTSVIGTVTTTEGVPLVGRIVELRPVTEQRRYDAVTNVDGEFRFPAIEAPLEYRLHVSGAPDHKDYDHRIRITAENSELDLVVEPYEFGSLSGRVVNREGAPIPDFDLVLRNTASERPNALITSDADGNFTVPAAPAGEIVIASQSMPSFLLRGLHLHPEEELSVPLVVDWGAHEIRGLVVDRQGNPVPASRIVLKWYHQFDGLSSVATRRTAADAQGSFQFSQLGPGPHSLHVDAPGYGTAALEYDASRQGYDITVRLN